jgi:hypothetical protein
MKETWFQHTDCTTEQADELLAQYRRRGVPVERSLNNDFITWTVSARLPEGKSTACLPPVAKPDVGLSMAIYRNKKWLAAVGQIERCVLCGAWGTQVAHRNEGKVWD